MRLPVLFFGAALFALSALGDDVVDRWRASVLEYPVPAPPASGVIEILPSYTLTQITNMISSATNAAVFLLKASAPDAPTTFRRWSVTPKTNQKFYGELHSDGRTRLITLKGSKDLTPGIVTWTTNTAGIWYCTETGALGGNGQASRYPAGYQRNAYGRTVVIDGTNCLNHIWPPSSTNGMIVSIALNSAGSGYTEGTYSNVALRPTTGTLGTGAVASVVVSNTGKVVSVALTAGGQDYTGVNLTGDIPGGGSGWNCTVEDFVRTLTNGANAFCLDDPANRLYLGFNPAGHTVEIMTDVDCFTPASGAEIYNLKVQHYANQIQDVPVDMGDDGRVEYVEVSYNHAGAIRSAKRGVIRNCQMIHNLQIGYKGPSAHNALLEGNEIGFNNTDLGVGNFITSWESGGGKISGSTNVIMRNNYSHDNGGPGIWFDIENGRKDGKGPVIMEGNLCMNNSTPGIFHEISYSAIIRGNYCRDNATQILVAESGPCKVYGNVAEVSVAKKDAIKFRQMYRVDDTGTVYYYCTNNYIHHNVIIHRVDTGQEENGASGVYSSGKTNFYNQLPPFGENWFDWNTYHVPATNQDYWTWWEIRRTIDEFRSFGHETNGVVIGDGATYADTTSPTTPPRPTITGGGPVTPTLSGTNEIAAMIRIYEGSQLVATTFADENGAWSVTLTGLSTNNHDLYVTASDPMKTASEPSPVVSTWNSAPSLAAIPDRFTGIGQTIAMTNSASDVDAPPQTLSYTLLSAPSNATLTADTGIFAWRVPAAFANTTNTVLVKVADSGYPSLSATQSLRIIVTNMVRPTINSATLSNQTMRLQVTGPAGPDYTVQVSTNLTSWSDLFTTNSPALPFQWNDPNAGNFNQRFYRVILRP